MNLEEFNTALFVLQDSAEQRMALTSFLETFDDSTLAERSGPMLSCRQAEALAELFRAFDMHPTAGMWLRGHAVADDNTSPVHYDSDGHRVPVGPLPETV